MFFFFFFFWVGVSPVLRLSLSLMMFIAVDEGHGDADVIDRVDRSTAFERNWNKTEIPAGRGIYPPPPPPASPGPLVFFDFVFISVGSYGIFTCWWWWMVMKTSSTHRVDGSTFLFYHVHFWSRFLYRCLIKPSWSFCTLKITLTDLLEPKFVKKTKRNSIFSAGNGWISFWREIPDITSFLGFVSLYLLIGQKKFDRPWNGPWTHWFPIFLVIG